MLVSLTFDVLTITPIFTFLILFLQMVFLVVSIPYYGIIKANQEGVQNMIGFLNIFTTQVMYSALSSVVNVVPEEMPVFIQETTDGVYSPVAFYVSKACFMVSSKAFLLILVIILYTLGTFYTI